VGKVRAMFKAKAKKIRMREFNLLVNGNNFGFRPTSYWPAAIISLYNTPGYEGVTASILRKLDFDTNISNVTVINDFSQYINTFTQHTQVTDIRVSPVDMRFRRYDERSGRMVEGRSDGHAAFCLVEFGRIPRPQLGEVTVLELQEDPLKYFLTPLLLLTRTTTRTTRTARK
jgi:hypothetical protein